MMMNKTLYKFLADKHDIVPNIDIPDNIVGDSDIKTMLIVKYGEREVYKVFHKLTSVEVANYINNLYNKKWQWLSEFIDHSFEIGETNVKKVTENYLNENTGNQSGSVTNSESAFNVDDFVNSDKSDTATELTGEQSGNRERIESYKSYYTSLQQMNNVNRNNMLELVLNDIQNELCLQVY